VRFRTQQRQLVRFRTQAVSRFRGRRKAGSVGKVNAPAREWALPIGIRLSVPSNLIVLTLSDPFLTLSDPFVSLLFPDPFVSPFVSRDVNAIRD